MKTIYRSAFVALLGCLSISVFAQKNHKDTTLTRQVFVEREYSPTLQDASKINSQPNIYSPTIKPRDIKFVSNSPQVALDNNKIGSVASGDINTAVDFNKKRGYLLFAGGTDANLDGSFGYRLVNGERDLLDVFASHRSASSNLKYIQEGFNPNEAKAKYAASDIALKYKHYFDVSSLSFETSFFNTGFNYYGNPFVNYQDNKPYPYNLDKKQNVDVFSFGAGLQSSDKNQGGFQYAGNLRYRNFKSKYGLSVLEDGLKGGQFDIDVDLYTSFGTDQFIGVKGTMMSQSLSNLKDTTLDRRYTNFGANPYIRFQGSNWDATLGLNLNAMFDSKNSLFLSPNLKASVHFDEKNTLYGNIGGGINNNTFLEVLFENRYVLPGHRVDYSKTVYDATLGFKTGALSGFELDVFGGYKYTKNEHLYIYAPSSFEPVNKESLIWGNIAAPIYDNIFTGHFGVLTKTTLIPYTDLSAKLVAYFYSISNSDVALVSPSGQSFEKKPWGKPTFTAELNADVKPMDKLTLSLNYILSAGRKTLFMGTIDAPAEIVSMKSISEVNVRGEYQITDWLSANVRLNNLLSQKYEFNYGYPTQGLNILGGVSLKF